MREILLLISSFYKWENWGMRVSPRSHRLPRKKTKFKPDIQCYNLSDIQCYNLSSVISSNKQQPRMWFRFSDSVIHTLNCSVTLHKPFDVLSLQLQYNTTYSMAYKDLHVSPALSQATLATDHQAKTTWVHPSNRPNSFLLHGLLS